MDFLTMGENWEILRKDYRGDGRQIDNKESSRQVMHAKVINYYEPLINSFCESEIWVIIPKVFQLGLT